jgi:hypothetical protein
LRYRILQKSFKQNFEKEKAMKITNEMIEAGVEAHKNPKGMLLNTSDGRAYCRMREALEAALAVAPTPDTATELRAERDAALAVLERIRQAVAGHPKCDRYEEGDAVSCGWKSAYASVVWALDGAPEPEWEYAAGYTALDGKPHPFKNRGYLRIVAEADREEYGSDEAIIVRRRKAGPWLPVEGEKP